jgi:16S rRNA processing protein RimM
MASKAAAPDVEMVVMARITAPFGIKGWLKLATFTEHADSLDQFDEWYVSYPTGWQKMAVEDFAVHTKSVVAKLKGVDDRTAAERLAKRDVGVPRDWFGDDIDGEYFWVDLIGLEVLNEEGVRLGRVDTLMETGANDVLVVKSGPRETLIPFVADYVVSVDREAQRITVHWDQAWEQDSK